MLFWHGAIVCSVSVFQLLNGKLDNETDTDKRDMLMRMKAKMDTSLNTAKTLIDSHGDGMQLDAARMVVALFILPAFCLLSDS